MFSVQQDENSCTSYYQIAQQVADVLRPAGPKANITFIWVLNNVEHTFKTYEAEPAIALYNAACAVSREDCTDQLNQLIRISYYLQESIKICRKYQLTITDDVAFLGEVVKAAFYDTAVLIKTAALSGQKVTALGPKRLAQMPQIPALPNVPGFAQPQPAPAAEMFEKDANGNPVMYEQPVKISFAELNQGVVDKLGELTETINAAAIQYYMMQKMTPKQLAPMRTALDQRGAMMQSLNKFLVVCQIQKENPLQAFTFMREIQAAMGANMPEMYMQMFQTLQTVTQREYVDPFKQCLDKMNSIVAPTPLPVKLLPKGYGQMITQMTQAVIKGLPQRIAAFDQAQKAVQARFAQFAQLAEVSTKVLVNSPTLAQIATKGSVQEKVQICQANSSSLGQFGQQAQQVYKFLQDLVTADQNNQRQYGMRWNSQQAMQVIYAAMQDAVNIVNSINVAGQGLQQLASFNPAEYQAIFQLLDPSFNKQQLDQKAQSLQQIRAPVDPVYLQMNAKYDQALQTLKKIATADDLKQFIIDSQIQLSGEPKDLNGNLKLIEQFMNQMVPDMTKIQELEKLLAKANSDIMQLNQSCVLSLKVNEQQIEALCQKLMNVVNAAESANQIIGGLSNLIRVANESAAKISESYSKQVNEQWPMFCNGSNIVLTLQK